MEDHMEKIICDVLNKLEENSYESYVVGGYVRDKLLGIESFDNPNHSYKYNFDNITIINGYSFVFNQR